MQGGHAVPHAGALHSRDVAHVLRVCERVGVEDGRRRLPARAQDEGRDGRVVSDGDIRDIRDLKPAGYVAKPGFNSDIFAIKNNAETRMTRGFKVYGCIY